MNAEQFRKIESLVSKMEESKILEEGSLEFLKRKKKLELYNEFSEMIGIFAETHLLSIKFQVECFEAAEPFLFERAYLKDQ